jgi:hypothetical protein
MIYTDEGRASTLEMLERFEKTIAALRTSPGPADAYGPEMRDVIIRGHESWIEDLQEQITEYDELRSGQVKRLTADSIDELGKALIRARIAAGITPEQLAERLGIGMQEMERLERFDYQEANLARIFEVVRTLDVEFQCEIRLSGSAAAKKSRSRKRAATLAAD